jgi:hypothetical protein
MTNFSIRTLTCATAAMLVATACGDRRDRDMAMRGDTMGGITTGTSAGTLANAEIDIDDLSLGRSVGTDGKIRDKTDEFRTNDDIVAVVETDDGAAGQELVARWTYRETQQVVEEQRQVVAGGDDARTTFRLRKASAWPAGNYSVQIMHNGREVKSKDFTVR